MQHKTVLIIFPPNLPAIIIAQMLSLGGEGDSAPGISWWSTNCATCFSIAGIQCFLKSLTQLSPMQSLSADTGQRVLTSVITKKAD